MISNYSFESIPNQENALIPLASESKQWPGYEYDLGDEPYENNKFKQSNCNRTQDLYEKRKHEQNKTRKNRCMNKKHSKSKKCCAYVLYFIVIVVIMKHLLFY